MEMGDIPCSEALKGEGDGIFSPKYDTQEEVFLTILNDLRESSRLFASAATFKGDPVYNGDPLLWRKNVNSFTLRVLNMLSKKQTVGSINVRDLFEQVAKEPLMENEGESYQRVYDAGKSSQGIRFILKNKIIGVSGDELFLSGYDERVARSSFVLLRRTCPSI